MRIVTIGRMGILSLHIKHIFSSKFQLIELKNEDCIKHFTFKKHDLIFLNTEDEEERFSIEEYLDNRYRLVCFYHKSEYYPFQTFSQTIFIPYDSDTAMIYEAVTRLGEEKDLIDKEVALIGSSSCMETVRYQIEKYARSKHSIHLSGSTGTGKNIAAKRIHRLSGLKSKMVYVNCGSCYNPNLLESNLFGCTKGAYTGATASRSGYLKNAHKSFLFLDEIENMPLYMQEMLLDVIESGKYKMIGSDVDTASDFRLITASNVPLDTLIKQGKLRTDFYYRIAHRKIHMPSLAEHMEDIPELVQYYERVHKVFKYRIKDYSPLFEKCWPGNVRELYNYLSIMHEDNALFKNRKIQYRI